MKSWHMRYGPLFDSQSGQVNDAGWRTTTRLHLHHCVFAGRISCHCLILSSPARISGKSSMRRWWHMPRALQFWVEKADLPTGGKPCLLAGSVVELWEEMKCYSSFSDKDVFDGIALLEETPIITCKEATTESTLPTLADPPLKEATVDMTMEPGCGEEASKQVSWLGESATPLQTHSCHQADSPFIKRPEAKAL